MKATNIINEIKKYIEDIRKNYPEITDDMLYTDGTNEFIFYMNGNDGTPFDYSANDRLCEFMLFYKETEMGFIKIIINTDNQMYGYLYLDKGYASPIKLNKVDLGIGSALLLATLMNLQADKKGLYDKPIDKINLNYNVKHDDCYRFANKYGYWWGIKHKVIS